MRAIALLLALWPVHGLAAPLRSLAPARGPVVPGPQTGARLPQIPQLPPAAPGLLQELNGGAPVLSAAAPQDAGAIPPAAQPQDSAAPGAKAEEQARWLVSSLPGGPDPSGAQSASFFGQLFDGRKQSGDVADPSLLPPTVPAGVSRVEVGVVRSARDVAKYVPDGPNSRGLIEELQKHIGRMGPYRVYSYVAPQGRVTAIDLSENPGLINAFPEQQSHEIALIKKIQLWTKDLQIVVREGAKTPDLVMGGVFTELKSLIGTQVDFQFLVNKANRQVYDHAERHGLPIGKGAAVIDLTREDSVPVQQVARDLNGWAKTAQNLSLEKVFVFAGNDLKLFKRDDKGVFRSHSPTAMPFARDLRAAQIHLARGELKKAETSLRALGRDHEGMARHPVSQGWDALEAERTLGELRALVKSREYARARSLWREFTQAKPKEAARWTARARKILTFDEGRPEPMNREIAEAARRLDEAGFPKTVAIYGGRELRPGSRYYELARRFGALASTGGEGRVAVVTKGGPGAAEAAAAGAASVHGKAAAFTRKGEASYPSTHFAREISLDFAHEEARDVALRRRSLGLVFVPGGFNTAQDLFEAISAMSSGRARRAPIILAGRPSDWKNVVDLPHLLKTGVLSPKEAELLVFADSAERAWEILSEPPVLARR